MIQSILHRFWRNQTGATMVEYGVVVGLIAAVCVAAVAVLGGNADSLFSALKW